MSYWIGAYIGYLFENAYIHTSGADILVKKKQNIGYQAKGQDSLRSLMGGLKNMKDHFGVRLLVCWLQTI